jgi:uncharacterized protein (DUF433 family)
MSCLDWSLCSAVESIPDKLGGAWVFRGTRMPVVTIFENLEDMSVDEILEQFDVSRKQIDAVLAFVAQSLKDPIGTHRRVGGNSFSSSPIKG